MVAPPPPRRAGAAPAERAVGEQAPRVRRCAAIKQWGVVTEYSHEVIDARRRSRCLRRSEALEKDLLQRLASSSWSRGSGGGARPSAAHAKQALQLGGSIGQPHCVGRTARATGSAS